MELILIGAALIAGATGTWSPCGFSAVESIGPDGHGGGRLLSVVAALTFLPGALAGGLITFGVLATLGSAFGGGSGLAAAAAAGIAVAAAAGEIANVRVVPQIRRQVPESWRHSLPLPALGAAYGLLLGLGFTTFVLTFGVWALAAITVAAGEIGLGLAIGAGFGLGRAIPVVVLAPIADTEAGHRLLDAMAERPATYRAFRFANAGALALAATAIVSTGALAKNAAKEPAYDPSAGGGRSLAYERPQGGAVLRGPAGRESLPGSDPAIGGRWVAVKQPGRIALLRRKSLERAAAFPAPDADALALARRFVLWRARSSGRDRIYARRIRSRPRASGVPEISFGPPDLLASSARNSQLGRPSADGSRAVWAVASRRKSSIALARLGGAGKRRILGSRRAALQNASIDGRHIAYVRISRHKQLLKLARIGGGAGRTIERRRRGLIWSTELTAQRVLATVRTREGLRIRSWRR